MLGKGIIAFICHILCCVGTEQSQRPPISRETSDVSMAEKKVSDAEQGQGTGEGDLGVTQTMKRKSMWRGESYASAEESATMPNLTYGGSQGS